MHSTQFRVSSPSRRAFSRTQQGKLHANDNSMGEFNPLYLSLCVAIIIFFVAVALLRNDISFRLNIITKHQLRDETTHQRPPLPDLSSLFDYFECTIFN